MNIVLGALVADRGSRFRGPGFSVAIPGSTAARVGAAGTRPVLLGVRPENLLVPAAPEASGATLDARVRHSELAGADRHLFLDIGGQTLVARIAPDVRTAAGETIRIGLDGTALHLFDAETEARID
jgi:multiple sugar transport system ATP-binding protein